MSKMGGSRLYMDRACEKTRMCVAITLTKKQKIEITSKHEKKGIAEKNNRGKGGTGEN